MNNPQRNPLVLGIDIGTYSSKAVLVDRDGSILAEAHTPHGLSLPRAGFAEHDADEVWWADLVLLCRQILRQATHRGIAAGEIAAVGVSAIGPCVLPVDREGRPLRPAILYGVDTRAQSQITSLNTHFGQESLRNLSGTTLSAQSAGPKIRWIRDNEPEVTARTWKYMTSSSYLVYRLTGQVVMDHYTAAFYDPLYDLKGQTWSDATASEICTAEQLPDLLWTSAIAGHVTAAAAAETGLAPGTPITTGTADAASEAVSAGVVAPGATMLMYGSSMFLISLSDALPPPGIFWSAPFLFPRTFALAAGMSTTGSLTQWFREHFAPLERAAEESGGESVYAVLAAEAQAVPPGSEGLIALPYFSGERTPINDPNARGVIAGLTLRTTRAHLYRALLEGVGYGIRHNLEEMYGSAGQAHALTAVGGGTKNTMWLQIVSDILGQPQTVRQTIGAAFGDAVLAALGCGLLPSPDAIAPWLGAATRISPNQATRPVYERQYPLFRDLYRLTAPVVHGLAESETSRD